MRNTIYWTLALFFMGQYFQEGMADLNDQVDAEVPTENDMYQSRLWSLIGWDSKGKTPFPIKTTKKNIGSGFIFTKGPSKIGFTKYLQKTTKDGSNIKMSLFKGKTPKGFGLLTSRPSISGSPDWMGKLEGSNGASVKNVDLEVDLLKLFTKTGSWPSSQNGKPKGPNIMSGQLDTPLGKMSFGIHLGGKMPKPSLKLKYKFVGSSKGNKVVVGSNEVTGDFFMG
ncbi:uncharacterized protein [Lepeophtheirus salmonis]|uniref:uncharacterized protein isoform X1 n=1 Tax=Lepeophtheirus salmonis TaxID=72036 RepID=UPI001AE1254C|nr:uncharacterized protein LOC121119131 isoform X1 [Lepeophtheirus salmonis]